MKKHSENIMNILKSTLIALGALSCAATAAELKVASVNLQSAINAYYKTQAAQKELTEARDAVKAENDERQGKIQSIMKELEGLQKQFQDPSVNDNVKKDIQRKFEVKRNAAVAAEKELKEFIERKQSLLNETLKSRLESILGEIQVVVDAKAKDGQFDIIFDSSALSAGQTRIFMFTKQSLDVTPSVIAEINKTAPAGYVAPEMPAPGAAPAAPATPAGKAVPAPKPISAAE